MFQPTLVPAYGADYKSKKEVLAALNNGHDFRCEPHGSYITLKECVDAGFTNINVRFKKLTQVLIFNIVDGVAKEGYR